MYNNKKYKRPCFKLIKWRIYVFDNKEVIIIIKKIFIKLFFYIIFFNKNNIMGCIETTNQEIFITKYYDDKSI
jgi:hypothetical protein